MGDREGDVSSDRRSFHISATDSALLPGASLPLAAAPDGDVRHDTVICFTGPLAIPDAASLH